MAKTDAARDAEDVARCLAGDSDAYGSLVQRYQGLAVAIAWSVCQDRALAEDIAQDAFFQAYRKLRQLSRPESYCAWLMNIVRNAALRAAHNVVRRKEVHEEATQDQGPHIENPSAAMELAELLEVLDDGSRQVMTLKYLNGMTCKEIANHLGVPIGTITSKISRALDTLRKASGRDRKR
jgi:RNA polymerase sigma-70 factor (ECF subfamily)